MPPGVIVLTVILMLVAFGCGYGALVVRADLSSPVSADGAPVQPFVVHDGDSVNTIASNLESQKLIRSAYFFKLYLKFKGQAFAPDPGTYQLSPSMTMDDIVTVLGVKHPKIVYTIRVIEGSRLSEYPDQILNSLADTSLGNPTGATLPFFSKADFIKYAIQGQPFDDLKNYWFVKPWNVSPGHAYAALEGYLFPATYQVYNTDTTTDIIDRMLNAFGEKLCPGPDSNPDEYLSDVNACKQNQAIITMPASTQAVTIPGAGTTMGVFDALDKFYGAGGKDYVGALQKALIIGSLDQREARSAQHLALVASTYYNRWKQVGNPETVGELNSDPAEQYYLASQPGYKGKTAWDQLSTTPQNLPNNPYNLYKTVGLPPSAISNPSTNALYGAIYLPKTNFVFFFFGCDNTNHYESTYAQFQTDEANIGVNQGPGSCPGQ